MSLRKLLVIHLLALTLGQNTAATTPNPEFVYRSFSTRTAYCTPSHSFIYPDSIHEIRTLIRNAGLFRKTLKALGNRHSTPDLICTDGTPMDMCKFKEMTLHSDGRATFPFGAGVTAGDAAQFLKEKGRAFIHQPSYDGITIGGAIGTGAHGSSLLHPASFSEQVTSLRVVDGLGQLRTISEGWELNIFRIHLGLLGVVIDVTFSTVPLFKLWVKSYPESDQVLIDGSLISLAEKYPYVQAAWWPSKEKVVIMEGIMTDPSQSGETFWDLYPETTEAESRHARDIYDALHASRNIPGLIAIEDNTLLSFYTKVVGRPPIQTEDNETLANSGVGYGSRLMSGGCTECDWMYGNNSVKGDANSIGCPLKELPGIYRTIKSILAANPAGFDRIQIRFQPPARGLVSIAYGRRTVVFGVQYHVTNDPNRSDSGLATYQAIVQALIVKHGGRPHWGKNGLAYHSAEVIRNTVPYPNWKTFSAAMYYYDPVSVFSNKFAHRFLGISNQIDGDPAVRHCALVDNCRCWIVIRGL